MKLQYHHRSLKDTGYSNNDIYKMIKNVIERDSSTLYKVFKISNLLPLVNIENTLSETLNLLINHNFALSNKLDISSLKRKLSGIKDCHKSVIVQIQSEFYSAALFIHYFSDYLKKITGYELPEFRYQIQDKKLSHNLEYLKKAFFEAVTTYYIKEINALPLAERETKLKQYRKEFKDYRLIKNTKKLDKYIIFFEEELESIRGNKTSQPQQSEKPKPELNKALILFSSTEIIESLHNKLKEYFQGKEAELLRALKGEQLTEFLLFPHNQNKFVEVFKRLKYNNFLLSTPKEINNWICSNFTYTRTQGDKKEVKNFNENTIKTLLTNTKKERQAEPTPKERICTPDWLPHYWSNELKNKQN